MSKYELGCKILSVITLILAVMIQLPINVPNYESILTVLIYADIVAIFLHITNIYINLEALKDTEEDET
jgi:hypothetical protein